MRNQYDYDTYEFPKPILTVKIGEQWHKFDAQTELPLEEAKVWHEAHGYTEYLGSGHSFYYDGVLKTWNKEHHFFKRPAKD